MATVSRTFKAGNKVNNVFHHTMGYCMEDLAKAEEGGIFGGFRCDPAGNLSLAGGAVPDCT
jgi:hypothetical protein